MSVNSNKMMEKIIVIEKVSKTIIQRTWQYSLISRKFVQNHIYIPLHILAGFVLTCSVGWDRRAREQQRGQLVHERPQVRVTEELHEQLVRHMLLDRRPGRRLDKLDRSVMRSPK